jgi:hypothetical protein
MLLGFVSKELYDDNAENYASEQNTDERTHFPGGISAPAD